MITEASCCRYTLFEGLAAYPQALLHRLVQERHVFGTIAMFSLVSTERGHHLILELLPQLIAHAIVYTKVEGGGGEGENDE